MVRYREVAVVQDIDGLRIRSQRSRSAHGGWMPMKQVTDRPERGESYLDSEGFRALIFLVALVSLGISIYTKDAT